MVKHLLIIGLCSTLALEALFPDVDLADVSHVPQLLAHFQKHRSQSPDISFVEFLSLHYNDPGHLSSTTSDHHNLPFSKKYHHRFSVQIAQETMLVYNQSTPFVLIKIESVFDPVVHSSTSTSSVWQPPRA